jgi:hypothetical protein
MNRFPKFGMFSSKLFWGLLLSYFVIAQTAASQEGRYLALRGPGTASVFWADGETTAYITDGGRGFSGGSLLQPAEPLTGERLESKRLESAPQGGRKEPSHNLFAPARRSHGRACAHDPR